MTTSRAIHSMNKRKGNEAEYGWLVLDLGVRRRLSEVVTLGQEAKRGDGGATGSSGGRTSCALYAQGTANQRNGSKAVREEAT